MQPLCFDRVAFAHDGAGAPLFSDLSLIIPAGGFTGIVGANGAGKTTLLRLACGEIEPTAGRVRAPPRAILCAQSTAVAPVELTALLASTDSLARELIGRLGIDARWPGRWATLSHGERKRAQIAVALWQRPDVLALDEPTNHIDAEARALLAAALATFGGVGLLVSHDRELLDALCQQCLVLAPPAPPELRPGGYSKAMALRAADEEQQRRARAVASREVERLEREVADRAREADGADRLRSKRGLDRHDHDGRAKIDAARVSGKDGQAGRLRRQLDGRVQQARDRLAASGARKLAVLGITMRGERSRADALLRVPAGKLDLGDGRALDLPELAVRPGDRIGIVGANGAGKSTLIRHLEQRLELDSERVVSMPQEIDAPLGQRLLATAHALPRRERGEVMAAVACLGSSPEPLLAAGSPSPGELRKLLLALGLLRRPHLIIMDEPTNHLDLPSIECLEQALGQCVAALLLVSHDRRFLAGLTERCWRIADGELHVHVDAAWE